MVPVTAYNYGYAAGYDRFTDVRCPRCGRNDLVERRPSQPTPWYWTCPDCRDDVVIPSPMTADRALDAARHALIDDPRLYAESDAGVHDPDLIFIEVFETRFAAWRGSCRATEREYMRRDGELGQVTLAKFVDEGADA